MTSGTPHHPDDPGRDPEGLNPPRDVLDSAHLPEEGSFTPGRHTQPVHAEEPPDEPPTANPRRRDRAPLRRPGRR